LENREQRFPRTLYREKRDWCLVVCAGVTNLDNYIPVFLILLIFCSGFNFGYSAWINSRFLGSGQGTNSYFGGIGLINDTWNFDVEDLHDNDNILTLVLDPTGELISFSRLTTYIKPTNRSGGGLRC
jgi:hypothetical protein